MKAFLAAHRKFFDYLSYQALQMAIGIVAIPILTRMVSVEEYGLISVSGTVAVMAFSVSFQWLQFVVSRNTTRSQNCESNGHRTGMAELGLSVLACIGFLSMAGWLAALPPSILVLIGLLSPVYAAIFIGMEALYMRQQSTAYRRLGNGYSVLKQTLGIGTVALFGLGAIGYVFGWLLASIASALLLFRQVGIRSLLATDKWHLNDAGPRFRYGYPLAMAGILEGAVVFLPTSLLAGAGEVAEVARFSVLWAVASAFVYLIPAVFVFNRYPTALAKFDAGEIEDFRVLSIETLKRALFIGVGLALLFCAFGPILVGFVGGSEYRVANSLCGLAAAHFVAMTLIRGLTFHYKAHQVSARLTARSLLASLAMAFSCLALLPRFGLFGAAAACLTWSGVLALLMCIDVRRSWQLKVASS